MDTLLLNHTVNFFINMNKLWGQIYLLHVLCGDVLKNYNTIIIESMRRLYKYLSIRFPDFNWLNMSHYGICLWKTTSEPFYSTAFP